MSDRKNESENGFDFFLYPARTEKAEALVVFLHGHGDHPDNWEDKLQLLRQSVPHADVIAVKAPIHLPAGTEGLADQQDGYAWVPIEFSLPAYGKMALSLVFNRLPVTAKFDKFVKAQLEKRAIDRQSLALVGFSFGGIIAIQSGLGAREPCAAVVSHGGAVLPFTKAKSRPDLLLVMGKRDEVFNRPKTKPKGIKKAFNGVAKKFSIQHDASVKRLQKRNVPFTEMIEPRLGHAASSRTWQAGTDFIAARLKPKKTI